MPTGLNTSTLAGIVVGSWRIYAGSPAVDLGATYGEPTITPADEFTQPPISGATQRVAGFDLLRSAHCRAEFVVASVVASNLTLANRDVAPTGSAPNQTWTPPAAHTFVPVANNIENLILIAQRTDGTWVGVRIPIAFVESRELVTEGDFKGVRFSVESRATQASPLGATYEIITLNPPPV